MASQRKVRIIAVPLGEAPLWVREKWVGLELPLAQKSATAQSCSSAGVLSGPKGFLSALAGYFTRRYEQESGFIVSAIPALHVLESASPEAAKWWYSNTPHLCKPWRKFLFHTNVCEVIAYPF
jgi:hypothetical protein